jgi:hypothetical protein
MDKIPASKGRSKKAHPMISLMPLFAITALTCGAAIWKGGMFGGFGRINDHPTHNFDQT